MRLYQARARDGTTVAVKIYHADTEPEVVRRAEAAYAAVRRNEHPNVVRVLDVGVHPFDGRFCIVTEWLGGGTMEDRMAGVDLSQRADWVRQLAGAIDFLARTTGLVHGDLKPSNVAFSSDGTPKIIDWDSAELPSHPNRTVRLRRNAGTPGFAAPEQTAGGRLDLRTDVYGLGAILHVAFVGGPPIPVRSDRDADWRKQARSFVPHLPERPTAFEEALRRVTQRCLRKARANRYATTAELAEDLSRAFNGTSATAPRVLPLYHRPRELYARYPDRVRRAVAAVVGVAVAVLVGVLVAPTNSIPPQGIPDFQVRNAEKEALLRRLEALDDSPDVRQHAARVASAHPDDVAMQLVPVALDLLAASTPEQHNEIPRRVQTILRDHDPAEMHHHAELFSELAEQHSLLVELVNHGFGETPKPRHELVRLERSIQARLAAQPTLKSVAGLPPLRRLIETVQLFNQTANRNDRPPAPYDALPPGVYWLYWQSVELDRQAQARWCAELHYQRGCARFAMVSIHVQRFAAATPETRHAESEQLARAIANVWKGSQEVLASPVLTRTSALTVKSLTLGTISALHLVRLSPGLPPKDFDEAIESVSNWRKKTAGAPLDVQLFSRLLVVECLCESDMPDLWNEHQPVHRERLRELESLGSNALNEWKRSETTPELWPSQNQIWSSEFIRNRIATHLREVGRPVEAQLVVRGQISPLNVSALLREIGEHHFLS
ncbi:MAG: serine/threonine protein kinase, partial [Gemmataceae bacterium]|nr:serine/threonine protein kinase [Gemmataceae bacterium]